MSVLEFCYFNNHFNDNFYDNYELTKKKRYWHENQINRKEKKNIIRGNKK